MTITDPGSPAPTATCSVTHSPWHAGELAVQERVGGRDLADRNAGGIQRTVPPAAVDFLAAQPMMVVAASDARHLVWVSALFGSPGFIRVPRPDVLDIDTVLDEGDPLANALAGAARVGMLAIEPQSRRRSRFNGLSLPVDHGLRVQLDQVFANCPKYIQKRLPVASSDASAATARDRSAPLFTDRLTERQRHWIAGADTFFIGTTDIEGNADASHRGGNPGFIEVLGPDHFRFPDYVGNSMYTTLGNLELRPAAGFLFLDWIDGSALHVSGLATVDFDQTRTAGRPGALRMVDVWIQGVIERAGVSPLKWGLPVPSRFNPHIEKGS